MNPRPNRRTVLAGAVSAVATMAIGVGTPLASAPAEADPLALIPAYVRDAAAQFHAACGGAGEDEARRRLIAVLVDFAAEVAEPLAQRYLEAQRRSGAAGAVPS